MKWTDAQSEAIELRNKNMLVSAAAGSGKTAVLVERIKRIIIEEQVDIDRLLVVTFTNAAAAEMKEKIIRAINDELENNSKNGAFLRKQMDKISNASISTFHAFALDIMREYFQLTDIEPDFKIGDEGDLEVLKGEALDELFASRFESGDPEFLKFLNAYSTDRNDNALKENLLKIYTGVMTVPESFQWLSENTESLNIEEEDFADSFIVKTACSNIANLVKKAAVIYRGAEKLTCDAGAEMLAEKCGADAESLEGAVVLAEQSEWDELRAYLDGLTLNRMTAKKDEKEAWVTVKDMVTALRKDGKSLLDKVKKKYLSISLAEQAEDIRETYLAAKTLQGLIEDFHAIFKAKKAEKNIVDFNDIEHYALEILQNEQVCEEYRQRYEYIFIDEYQDSNILQDTLISRVKREDNLFMVGDVKQSIYKFRLAEPELFQRKYKEYNEDESGKNAKLDLNKNFRSKDPVINAVNCIFSKIMPGYDEAAMLHRGDPYEGNILHRAELYLVDQQKSEEQGLPEEIQELRDVELEAHAAARVINESLGTAIYDSKKQEERTIKKRDIVILMRSVKNAADIYQKVLKEQGIPTYVESGNGYFDTVEVEVFLDLLRLIDNSKQDIPLLSIMRSAIMGFEIEELAAVRLIDKTVPYHQAVKLYCSEGSDPALREKCKGLLQKIAEFRETAQTLPLEELIWKLMWDTGYYNYVGALPGGVQRQANLKALVDRGINFQSTHDGGIYDFLKYIEAIGKKKVEIGQVKLLGEQDDVVRIMTIHKSKGLEFPIVIVAGLGKRLRGRSPGKREILMHKDIGVGMARTDYDQMWFRKTLMQTLIESKNEAEEAEEGVRVLYVAATRARDKLVFIGTVKDAQQEMDKYEVSEQIMIPKKYLDYIGPVCDRAEISVNVFGRELVAEQTGDDPARGARAEKLIGPVAIETYKMRSQEDDGRLRQLIDSRLSFRYEDINACAVKSKYSVTELNREAEGKTVPRQSFLKEPTFARDDRKLAATEKGTLMHLLMEHINIKEAYAHVAEGHSRGEEYIKSTVKELVSKELLTEEEAGAVDTPVGLQGIMGFFKTDLGRRAANADKIYREVPFNILKEIDGAEVMVQGIIDCYFEEAGKLILIDYKTSYIDPRNLDRSLEELKEQYRGQIRLYRDALEIVSGRKVEESYLYLFGSGSALAVEE